LATLGFPLFLSITENGRLILRIVLMNAAVLYGAWAVVPGAAVRFARSGDLFSTTYRAWRRP
jgi:hypothetical protein